MKKLLPLGFCLLTLLIAHTANAREFFNIDFEDGQQPPVSVPPNANSEWSLPPIFESVYGPGNHFLVTDATSHSGNYSLRFTYEGRNGFCNTCGTKEFLHNQGLDGVDFFVSDVDIDLTSVDDPISGKTNKGPAAAPGKIIYNKSNGYSKWEIVAVESSVPEDPNAFNNDKLIVKLLRQGINGEPAEFNSNDAIGIARQCGVDGTVGNDIDRRSDCDQVITWFTNVSDGSDPLIPPAQVPGSSIFRRVYLKQEITSPHIHQKLHYIRPDRGGEYQDELRIFADSRRGPLAPQITNFKSMGGPGLVQPGSTFNVDLTNDGIDNPTPSPNFTNNFATDFMFERSVWYYVEEEYQASTLNPTYNPASDPNSAQYDAVLFPNPDPNDPNIYKYNPDGAFRLWIKKSGQEGLITDPPTVTLTGLRFPPIVGGSGTHISFWGNIQHSEHTRGSWYIDDMRIADTRIFTFNADGSSVNPASGKNIAPPTPPTITIKSQ